MKPWVSPLRNVRFAALLSAVLATAIYLNAAANDFAYDDRQIIVENPEIQSPETLPGAVMKPYWPSRYGRELGLWRPGTTALFGLQWIVFDGNAVGFHVVNILLHAAVTALVVVFLARLIPVGAAFLAGLVFAVHPVHVEAVANVVGQSEMLAAGLYLLACLVYLGARPLERLGWGRGLAVCALFALAFAVKEMAVTLPGVLFLLDGAREELELPDLRAYLRRRWGVYAGLVGIGGILLWIRFDILGSVARPFAPLGAQILEEIPRIWTVAAIWPHYVRLLFYPADLISDYSPEVIPILIGWSAQNLVGVLVVLLFLALAWGVWRASSPMKAGGDSIRVLGFGVLWFVITISPVSNLLFLSGVLLAERTLYLPSVGFAAAVGWVLVRIFRERRWAGVGITVAVLALMGWRSWVRTPTWEDNLTVFDTLVREHPEAGRGHWVLGDVHYQRGDVSSALASYRAAIGIIGSEYPLLAEIGSRLAGSGHYDQAEALLRFAWEQDPRFSQAPGLLAIVLADQERFGEAEEAARGALEAEPDDAVMHHLLARALERQGRPEEALPHRLAAIRLGEGHQWEQWKWLAELYRQVGDTARALEALDSARIRVNTGDQLHQIDSIRTRLAPGAGSM